MNKFKGFALAVLLALGLSALAPAMPSPMRDVIVTTASAACGIHQGGECGRDAVFHNNEPRWRGGYGYQNRNYGGGHAGGRHAHRSGYAQGSSRMVAIGTYRRVIRVYRPSAVAVEQPVAYGRARCGTPRCYSRPSRPAVRSACRTGCNPRPTCSTCGGGVRQDRNQSIVVKNVGAGANVTITATATQSVGGGAATAGAVASKGQYGAYVQMSGTPGSVSKVACTANGKPGFRGVDELGRSGCVHQ